MAHRGGGHQAAVHGCCSPHAPGEQDVLCDEPTRQSSTGGQQPDGGDNGSGSADQLLPVELWRGSAGKEL
jgi:hypothetical protein